MNKTVSAIIGMTMTLALAGISFAAQTTPAPKAASKVAATSATGTKSTKKSAKKTATKSTAAKKAVTATPVSK